MSNPLGDLCKSLGLSPYVAAKLAGVEVVSSAHIALVEPSPAVQAVWKIADALGARLVMKPAKPFQLCIDLRHIDALYKDTPFRRGLKLPAWTPTRKDLRGYVLTLRQNNKQAKLSYRKIVKRMERGHLCTALGERRWQFATVAVMIRDRRNRKLEDDGWRVEPGQQALDDWRDMLLQRVIAEAYPYDPFLLGRYGFTPADECGWRVYSTPNRVPQFVRAVLELSLPKIPWLEGAWRIKDIDQSPASNSPRQQRRESLPI